MNVGIMLAVAALKAGVSSVRVNKIVQELLKQGLEISLDKIREYLQKAKEEVSAVLTDQSLKKMNVPEDKRAYIREEIMELIQKIRIDEELVYECQYDAGSLEKFLLKKYCKQKKNRVEYEGEIQKILLEMSKKAISLAKEEKGFIENILIHIESSEKEQTEQLREIRTKQDEILDKVHESKQVIESEQKKRLPDRTEKYRKKWNENMFLNNFDEDDEAAGVNITLQELYEQPVYRWKDNEKDSFNLMERLKKHTQGDDPNRRMLLILGQPGMGKSTMITWFINQFQSESSTEKKEILVYRFTDIEIGWNEEGKKVEVIADKILKYLNMEKEELSGKILILDGFDEVAVGNNRGEILNQLYHEWLQDTRIQDFSLFITCRENYVDNLLRLKFPYITLQPWNEGKIEKFCRKYEALAGTEVSEEAICKMKKMKDILGIPLILYMTLALKITVGDESSVTEVYDQIFNLEGGIYERCLAREVSQQWDNEHRIVKFKEQIHQFSREIAMWMFENNPNQAAISKEEYEKIRDKIFDKDGSIDKIQKGDVLIGNYFQIVPYYDGINTEELRFVHRSIYEYFVAETISSEISELISDMSDATQEKLAGVLGYRMKSGKIDQTISQYMRTKVDNLTARFNEEKKCQFYVWMEQTVGKMMDAGMLYYTGRNINEYKNVIEKEIKCFVNLLDVLRLFLDYSDRKYIMQDINQEQKYFYICHLVDTDFRDLSKTYLRGVDLKVANLREADLREADLREADLREADLIVANLSGADLSGADLSGANLKGANLIVADLSGADLIVANLKGANLSGADLSGANLKGANLKGANLKGANLIGVNLSGADLSGANLIGTDLIVADLRGADLSGANLIGTDLIVAN